MEELTITLCEISAVEAIEKLLESPLPSLRSSKMEFKYDHDISTLRGGLWQKLESLAADSGIELLMSLADKEKRGWAVAAAPVSTKT